MTTRAHLSASAPGPGIAPDLSSIEVRVASNTAAKQCRDWLEAERERTAQLFRDGAAAEPVCEMAADSDEELPALEPVSVRDR